MEKWDPDCSGDAKCLPGAGSRCKEVAQLVDVSDGIKDEEGNLKAEITVEGIHLYAGGYRPIFEALKPYILA